MDTELLLHERHQVSKDSFAELRIWRISSPVHGSAHLYKYSLAYVVAGQCVLRYDNEAGKGDHRHFGSEEHSYSFRDPAQLLADFWSDVDDLRKS
ncbi:toxin-antitoxin system TumE family protein [Desulfovermiculus halophilus]|jgi:hypothetical protein|uniref:toxin-antitoxin system TumE family protein n=1 Tax=Desulfovermiculus halophilus TaxID=339722 RepID=UPI000A0499FD|nr:DUF6516 family protein [Desulfovermiculus halophilus]